jgi:hypothetical protein
MKEMNMYISATERFQNASKLLQKKEGLAYTAGVYETVLGNSLQYLPKWKRNEILDTIERLAIKKATQSNKGK